MCMCICAYNTYACKHYKLISTCKTNDNNNNNNNNKRKEKFFYNHTMPCDYIF